MSVSKFWLNNQVLSCLGAVKFLKLRMHGGADSHDNERIRYIQCTCIVIVLHIYSFDGCLPEVTTIKDMHISITLVDCFL